MLSADRNQTHAEELRLLERERLGGASFALLAASAALVVPVVATNLVVKARRNSPSIYSTVFLGAEFLSSLTFIATSTPVLGVKHVLRKDSAVCIVQGVVLQFLNCVLVMSWLLCAYALFKIVAGPPTAIESLRKSRCRHLTGCVVLSAMLTAIAYAVIGSPEPQANGLFCWLNNDAPFWSKFVTFHVWFFLILCIGCGYIIPVVRKLRSVFNEQTENGPRLAIRDFVHRQMLMMVAFLVVFVCVTQEVIMQCFSAAGTFTIVRDSGGKRDEPTTSPSAPAVTNENNNGLPPMIQVSETVFTIAYSSVGILGFLVFERHGLYDTSGGSHKRIRE